MERLSPLEWRDCLPWLASLSPLMSVRLLPLGESGCLPRSGFNVGANVSLASPMSPLRPPMSVICWWKPRGSVSDQRPCFCRRRFGQSYRRRPCFFLSLLLFCICSVLFWCRCSNVASCCIPCMSAVAGILVQRCRLLLPLSGAARTLCRTVRNELAGVPIWKLPVLINEPVLDEKRLRLGQFRGGNTEVKRKLCCVQRCILASEAHQHHEATLHRLRHHLHLGVVRKF